jgi:hypothetical protein
MMSLIVTHDVEPSERRFPMALCAFRVLNVLTATPGHLTGPRSDIAEIDMKHFGALPSFSASVRVLLALLLMSAAAAWRSDAHAGTAPTYSIDFYVISAGGSNLKNSCFRLSGTIGQPAPGYFSGAIYSLIAGYWQPAPSVGSDEIFYNGFEGCSS